jgi:hypothetical protein
MNEIILNKAKDAYYDKFKGLNLEDNEHLIPELMLEFATEMCELQKQECENYIDRHWYHISKDANVVLNCKNVCTT